MRNDPLNADLLGKADALAERISALKGDAAAARGLALQAQADEAVTRAELTTALAEALAARARAETQRRAAVADRLMARPRGDLRRRLAGLFKARRTGPAQTLEGHPLFDVRHYLGHGPDLAPGEDAVEHYLRVGWSEGVSPHPLFDPAWYGAQAPRSAAGGPLLLHYLSEGGRQGLSPHPLFDPAWYLAQYPDVADWEPLSHFVAAGAAEGRSPGPWFDLPAYVAARGPALAPEANPLVDYLQGGAWTIAEARPGLSTTAYLAAHPELARDGQTPLEHWVRRGQPPPES